MTVYKLLEILNEIKNKDMPVYIGRDISCLYAAKAGVTMAFPDDIDPDEEEGVCFQIMATAAPDGEASRVQKKKK